MGFFAHAYATATYLVNDPRFGWISFGGNLTLKGSHIRVAPKDSGRSRFFIAPAGLWLTLDAGKFDAVEYDSTTGRATVTLAAATAYTPSALIRIEKTTSGDQYAVQGYPTVRGAQQIRLGKHPTTVVLTPMREGTRGKNTSDR